MRLTHRAEHSVRAIKTYLEHIIYATHSVVITQSQTLHFIKLLSLIQDNLKTGR